MELRAWLCHIIFLGSVVSVVNSAPDAAITAVFEKVMKRDCKPKPYIQWPKQNANCFASLWDTSSRDRVHFVAAVCGLGSTARTQSNSYVCCIHCFAATSGAIFYPP